MALILKTNDITLDDIATITAEMDDLGQYNCPSKVFPIDGVSKADYDARLELCSKEFGVKYDPTI